ncbi:glycosyl hydrolase [Nonomuraea basaltis]|uniref:glycosyl hydrolase n=1 Tax=Nonomuraea basaltis TaxID=2495887 RepID=UPI00110C599F|nr:glycosyl hydrolase [Nonomuraea basaltis]TMR94514.1 glycosyl hydrolase [Nonomuraea basaltis]
MTDVPRPLYRDPMHDGATDPTVIWNRAERAWWLVYTSRRATAPDRQDVSWIHGTDLGVASSADGGVSWLYRGTIEGLDTEWGRHTYWAPEIVDDGSTYHMYVSVIRGVPGAWRPYERHIRHYTSPDLVRWTYRSTLGLSSSYVIDACVAALPGGGYRLWYKDEADDSHTWAADSQDLYHWQVKGPAVTISVHEGPNVFALGGRHWMIVDEWHGQRVLRSDDLETWQPLGLVLDKPGSGEHDGGYGHHADVVVTGEEALAFYFTHLDAPGGGRRSAVHAARLRVRGDELTCDRDEKLTGPILPREGPVTHP